MPIIPIIIKTILSKTKTKYMYMQKGFTLIELMVVISIISIITAATLFNSSKLNSNILLSNTAYEVSLIIRNAQVAGLGAKVTAVNGVTGTATTSNQGVYFDMDKPEQVIFFADLDRSNTYNNTSEDSQIFNIENKRAGKILKICKPSDTNNSCTSIQKLNMIFKRPNPEVYFYPNSETTGLGYIGNIVINMGFDGGECKSITVYKTGAIQIDKNYCPEVQ